MKLQLLELNHLYNHVRRSRNAISWKVVEKRELVISVPMRLLPQSLLALSHLPSPIFIVLLLV